MENGRCDMHGGKSTGAPLKHGRYSKYLPTRLAEKYQQALEDGELASVTDETAILQALIAESLQGIDLGNSEAMWETLWALCKDWVPDEDLRQFASQVRGVVHDGIEEWRKVRRLLGYVEQKRRLAETEQKRMRDMGQFINAQQANALLASVVSIIKENVTDPVVLSRISAGIGGLVAERARQ